MSKRMLSNEEQEQLRKNPNVARVSERSITYARTFKEYAVKQYDAGITATEIFKEAGFNLNLIGRKQPKYCLRRWRLRLIQAGTEGLSDTRGKVKKKRIPRNTETDRMKWLEAEVKYLKAENSFLAQLRAKRAERYSGRSRNTKS